MTRTFVDASTPESSTTEREIGRQIGRGKSVLRALADAQLADWGHELSGSVLDLAAGQRSSYRSALFDAGESDVRSWVSADIRYVERQSDVGLDATDILPFRDAAFDAVIVSWFLFIPADPVGMLEEVRRVLRPSGVLLVTAPLVFPVNPEPTDYWRYTEDGLRNVVSRAGFGDIEVVQLGGRWSAAAYLLSPFLRPIRPVRIGAVRLALWLDRLFARRAPQLAPCPIGYCAKALA